MAAFKGYSKVATSDTKLRIDKRERIIACILGGATLEKLPPDVAVNYLSNSSNQEWQSKNLVQLTICEHESNRDYFDWKVNMIQETDWLSNLQAWEEDHLLHAQWHDTRKLRIYYKWIFRNKRKTFHQVLKYMHSPLFAAVMIMDSGAMNKGKELLIDLGLNYGESADLMQAWFKDVLGIAVEVIKTPETHCLSFDQLNSRKVLSAIKPIVQDIPSMHEKLYPHAANRN